jgi:hypothetical protein
MRSIASTASASWADLESQLDCGGSHLLSDERADRRVDGRSRNRLTTRLAILGISAITNIPGVEAASSGRISSAEISATSATHGASLQQRCAFPRWRAARDLVPVAVAPEDLEVVLILLPGNVSLGERPECTQASLRSRACSGSCACRRLRGDSAGARTHKHRRSVDLSACASLWRRSMAERSLPRGGCGARETAVLPCEMPSPSDTPNPPA